MYLNIEKERCSFNNLLDHCAVFADIPGEDEREERFVPDDLSSASWDERGGGSPVPVCDLAHYREVMRRSLEEPAEFWAEVASEITWSKPWKRVLDDSDQPFTKWFVN